MANGHQYVSIHDCGGNRDLILMEDFDAIGFRGDPDIDPVALELRGGTLTPGDLVQSITQTKRTAAGFVNFCPAGWVAEYLGLCGIMLNNRLQPHACFRPRTLTGEILPFGQGDYRDMVIAFCLMDGDLHYTTKAHSSRVLLCEQIDLISKSAISPSAVPHA